MFFKPFPFAIDDNFSVTIKFDADKISADIVFKTISAEILNPLGEIVFDNFTQRVFLIIYYSLEGFPIVARIPPST